MSVGWSLIRTHVLIRLERGKYSTVESRHQMKMATSPATLTLTKRGRTVLMVSALIVATSSFAATFSAFNGAAASTTSAADNSAVAAEEIIVQPGESYWSIARAIAPGRSTQDVIDQIHELNPFAGATLQAGTKILVPLVK